MRYPWDIWKYIIIFSTVYIISWNQFFFNETIKKIHQIFDGVGAESWAGISSEKKVR